MKKVTYPKEVLDKMQSIVDDCMGDAPAYCEAECPMHTDVKGYVNLIAEGKHKEAISVIREKLFLPATLGRICAHPCEDKCKREEVFRQPMAVAALKRFAADNYDDKKDWDLTIEAEKSQKVAVIGAGPAGAQAALDLRRKGYDVTVYEKLPVFGGMMRVGIPEYRLPRDIIDHEYSLLEDIGVKFKMGVEVGKDVSFEELKRDYDAIIIAIGAHKGVGEYALPCSIYMYKQNNKDVDINLEINNTNAVVKDLVSRTINIGVLHGYKSHEELVIEKITSDRLLLVTSLPLVKDKISTDELLHLPLIFRENGSGTRKTILESMDQLNIKVDDLNNIYELNSMEAIKTSVIASKGISFIPELTIKRELKDGVLKHIQIEGLEIFSDFYIAYRKEHELLPFELDFISFIQSSKRGFC